MYPTSLIWMSLAPDPELQKNTLEFDRACARGIGLIGGVELVADRRTKRAFEPTCGVGARCVRFAEENGLIVRSVAGDVVSICPPLVITTQEIDELFDRLARALDQTLDWAQSERLLAA